MFVPKLNCCTVLTYYIHKLLSIVKYILLDLNKFYNEKIPLHTT